MLKFTYYYLFFVESCILSLQFKLIQKLSSMKAKLFLLATMLLIVFSSCLKDNVKSKAIYYSAEDYQVLSAKLNLPELPYDYTFNSSLATLGRVLFYDTNLSSDKSISCASCHRQKLAFSDNVAHSKGVNGDSKRNSIALFGGFQYYAAPNSFFWDERAKRMEDQPGITIQDPIEMDMKMEDVVKRIKKEDYYKVLFRKAFQSEDITEEKLTAALVHFVRSIVSNQSKYDEEIKKGSFGPNRDFKGYTDAENLGKKLYQENCAACHGILLNPTVATANNGLDMEYTDKGVGALNHDPGSFGVFKVPLIRNVELTAPYMHDGRFKTLEEVIDFYSEGIQDHPNLHTALRDSNGKAKKMNFTQQEKDGLVAFLKTLTDRKFITDKKYSNPFK